MSNDNNDQISTSEWIANKRAELGLNETPTDSYEYTLKKERLLQEWEQKKKAEAQAQERERKQAELERYLRRREQDWADTTGEQPSPDERRRWRREYLDEKEREHQAKRKAELNELYPH